MAIHPVLELLAATGCLLSDTAVNVGKADDGSEHIIGACARPLTGYASATFEDMEVPACRQCRNALWRRAGCEDEAALAITIVAATTLVTRTNDRATPPQSLIAAVGSLLVWYLPELTLRLADSPPNPLSHQHIAVTTDVIVALGAAPTRLRPAFTWVDQRTPDRNWCAVRPQRIEDASTAALAWAWDLHPGTELTGRLAAVPPDVAATLAHSSVGDDLGDATNDAQGVGLIAATLWAPASQGEMSEPEAALTAARLLEASAR